MAQTTQNTCGVFSLVDDETVSSSHRALSVRQLREKPPADSAHLPQDMTFDLCDLAPSVVHYAVSSFPCNLTSVYSRLSPPPFPTGSVSNSKLLSWEIPKDGQAVTRGPCSDAGGSGGSGVSVDPAVCLDQRAEVEEAEVENSPHSPLKSDCQPNSPAESSGCSREAAPPPKVCNWKKYKFIVLNSAEEEGDPVRNSSRCVPDPLTFIS